MGSTLAHPGVGSQPSRARSGRVVGGNRARSGAGSGLDVGAAEPDWPTGGNDFAGRPILPYACRVLNGSEHQCPGKDRPRGASPGEPGHVGDGERLRKPPPGGVEVRAADADHRFEVVPPGQLPLSHGVHSGPLRRRAGALRGRNLGAAEPDCRTTGNDFAGRPILPYACRVLNGSEHQCPGKTDSHDWPSRLAVTTGGEDPRQPGSPSSSGPGLRPFTAAARVRIPLGIRSCTTGLAPQGPVAQLVSAPPCHGGGRGFESRRGRQLLSRGEAPGQVAQLVRASD